MVVVKHELSLYSVDNYAKAPSKLSCGHQMADHDRPVTKMLLDGIWVPAPDNPGAYGRTYGDEIYRHVLHVKSSKNTYNDQDAEFRTYGQFFLYTICNYTLDAMLHLSMHV